jgi:hypothetical protein
MNGVETYVYLPAQRFCRRNQRPSLNAKCQRLANSLTGAESDKNKLTTIWDESLDL